MHKTVEQPALILASNSPRRQELLKQAGISFAVVPSSIDEASICLSSPQLYVKKLAEAKAQDISRANPSSWVIGADTVVFIDDILLGKPESRTEARDMLSRLNGRTHWVLTGYCICCQAAGRFFSETIETEVCFKKLSSAEIDWYLDSGESYDKAGAYAIQGKGTFLVKRISGSYTNVVGLPVCEVLDYLINEGVVKLGTDETADLTKKK